MKRLLFVNACVRKDSRTKQLAKYLLSKFDGEIIEISLSESKKEIDYIHK